MPDEKRCPQCKHSVPVESKTCGWCGYVPGQPITPVQIGSAAQASGRELLAPEERRGTADAQRVAIVDVEMPFGSMVVFILKWALASIPAFLVLFVVFFLLSAIFAGLVGR